MTQAESFGVGSTFERHGGRLDEAVRVYPGAPRPWIDLSTGINPIAWRPPGDLVIDPAPLPTLSSLRALEAAAARNFGVATRFVAAVPGSEIALRLLPTLGLPAPIVAVTPGYGTHQAVAGATMMRAALNERHSGTLLVANPNNPDGVHLGAADRAGDGAWTVVDEAFVDAMPDRSVLRSWDGAAPLVVMRSFGKFFGLAGVRLGFVVAPVAVIDRLRQLLGDWPVSAQAIAWGCSAYADNDWIATARRSLAGRAGRLDALLAGHGLAAAGECPLFRLVEHADARRIFAALARAGILTRPFAYRDDWLRFGLPADDAAFERLDRALGDG